MGNQTRAKPVKNTADQDAVRFQANTSAPFEMPVQRLSEAQSAEPSAQESLQNTSSGQTLDPSAREFLEPRFGHSFENIRIHADGEADRLSQNFQARAFTTGSDVFFREGAYNPNSRDGLHLLAHELTHTIQQSQGPVSGTPTDQGVSVSDPSDSFEQAAEQTADAVMNSGAVTSKSSSSAAGNVLQRKALSDEDGDAALEVEEVSSFVGSTIQRDTPKTGPTNTPATAPANNSQGRMDSLEKKQKAETIDSKWRSQFSSRLSGYRQSIYALTQGFQAATTGFNGAQAKQAQADAIKDQVFAAILGVGAAGLAEPFLKGSLGLLGMKLTNISGLIETLENPLVAVAQGTANVGAAAQGTSRNQSVPSPTGGGGTGGAGGDPMTFLTSNLQDVEKHTQKIESAFSERANKRLQAPDTYWESWNPSQYEQGYSGLMTDLDAVALSDPAKLSSGQALAVKIELYFWAAWIKSHGSGKGLFIQSEIATRLKALGLESLANVRFDTDSWIFMNHKSVHWNEDNSITESSDPKVFENSLRSWAAGWKQSLSK